MRRALVCLAVAIAVAASVQGAESAKSKSKSRTTVPTSRPAVVKSLRGEIANLNIETKVITVRTTSKQGGTSEVAVSTDEKTEFTIDGTAATLVDLKVGMPVSIQPDTGVAARVLAKSPPAVRKTKSTEPAKSKAK